VSLFGEQENEMSKSKQSAPRDEWTLLDIPGLDVLETIRGSLRPDTTPPVNDTIWSVTFTYEDSVERLLFATAILRVGSEPYFRYWQLVTSTPSLINVRAISLSFRVYLPVGLQAVEEEPDEDKGTGKGRIIITQRAGIMSPSLKDYYGGNEFDIP